jgi:hypothetical protein
MQGVPVHLWTCDRCGESTQVAVDSAPEGWHIVSATLRPETRQATSPNLTQDWCTVCVEKVFGAPREWSR